MSEPIFLALIRHGPTQWNAEKKIQGRTDTVLSADGERLVATWQVPPRARNWRRCSSPLKRAVQTVAALQPTASWEIESALIETDWGEYEGQQITALREKLGTKFLENESRGLDFQPPAGESPRDVQRRLKLWLEEQSVVHESIIGVTHKGVIRAALALACDWDMTGKPPEKLKWEHAHIFVMLPGGRLEVDEVNVSLTEAIR